MEGSYLRGFTVLIFQTTMIIIVFISCNMLLVIGLKQDFGVIVASLAIYISDNK